MDDGAPLSLPVTINLEAVVAPPSHIIVATAVNNGSIEPSGEVDVDVGASQLFTITANSGYHIADILVDDVSVGALSEYTFENVIADHTIKATFARDDNEETTTTTVRESSPGGGGGGEGGGGGGCFVSTTSYQNKAGNLVSHLLQWAK